MRKMEKNWFWGSRHSFTHLSSVFFIISAYWILMQTYSTNRFLIFIFILLYTTSDLYICVHYEWHWPALAWATWWRYISKSFRSLQFHLCYKRHFPQSFLDSKSHWVYNHTHGQTLLILFRVLMNYLWMLNNSFIYRFS